MMKKAFEKLKEWFGGNLPLYRVMSEDDSAVVFLTVSDGERKGRKTLQVIRIFALGNSAELSEDFIANVDLSNDNEILTAILDIAKTYKRVI